MNNEKILSHQDLTVLHADEPKQLKIGFTIKEYLGAPICKPNAVEVLLTKKDDIHVGVTIWVPGLTGWLEVTVQQDGEGHLYGESGKLVAFLEFDQDDRHCWVQTGIANTRGLERLTLSS